VYPAFLSAVRSFFKKKCVFYVLYTCKTLVAQSDRERERERARIQQQQQIQNNITRTRTITMAAIEKRITFRFIFNLLTQRP
jgi:sensor histidine kinase YesM